MNSTGIEWCDFTWNPVTGCPGPKLSAGCAHCYAERMANTRLRGRCGYDPTEPFMVTYHEDKLEEPLKMAKPKRIFVCSMGDLFHDDVDPDYIDEVFAVMAMCPQHEFFVLTKRVDRMENYLTSRIDGGDFWERMDNAEMYSDVYAELEQPYGEVPTGFAYDRLCRLEKGAEHASRIFKEKKPLPNVRLMATVCNQEEADRLLPILLSIPGGWEFGVSLEPLLGPVNLTPYLDGWLRCTSCDWFGDYPDWRCVDCGHVVSYTEAFPENGPELWAWGAICPKCGVTVGPNSEREKPFASSACPSCKSDIVEAERTDRPAALRWVICGGENGQGARPVHPYWVKSIYEQCWRTWTPLFFKGWGAWLPLDQFLTDPPISWLCSYVYEDGQFYPTRIKNGLHSIATYRCKRPENTMFYGERYQEFPLMARASADVPTPSEPVDMDPVPF